MMKYFAQAIKSVLIWLTVLALHALVLWQLLQVAPAKTLQKPPKPIMVSLITLSPIVIPPPSPKPAKKPLSKKKMAKKVKKVKKKLKPRKVKKKAKKRQKPVVRKKVKTKRDKISPVPPLLKKETLPVTQPLLTEDPPPPFIKRETPSFHQGQPENWAKQTKTTSPSQQRTEQRQRNQSNHGVKENIGITTPPSYHAAYLHNPPPSYPRLSQRRGEEGTVLLRVKVSQNGRTTLVQIKKSSGFTRLDKAAHKVMSKWRFVPAQKAGKAVSGWVVVPMVFKLD